jgi:hypothetical protein
MRELRTAVLTLVEASWEDQSGNLQTVAARMEDKSVSGACIRMKTPITVGSRLRIEWRLKQFSGIAKYCRSEGRDYLLGIQRQIEGKETPVHRWVPIPVARHEDVGSLDPVPPAVNPVEIPVVTPEMESVPIATPAVLSRDLQARQFMRSTTKTVTVGRSFDMSRLRGGPNRYRNRR